MLAPVPVQHSAGEEGTAADILQQARRRLRRRDELQLLQRVDETEALFAIRSGDLDHVAALVERLHEPGHARVLACLCALLGDHDGVVALLSPPPGRQCA